MDSPKIELIKEAALDKKAFDLQVISLKGLASFTDFLLICSGDSPLQRKAIVQSISLSLKHGGDPIHHQEGEDGSGWVLLDCYEVIVHVFAPEIRNYYDLPSIWSGREDR
ncbi:MAG: ribosome silencing factor [bacterium]